MWQAMSAARQVACVVRARAASDTTPGLEYPSWYLKHWHFLPDGYLSPWCAAAYEAVIRRVYNAGQERRVLRALAGVLAAQGPGNVLELGCGPGRALAALAGALPGAALTGIELSPFLLERARARVGGMATLVHGDATAALPPGRFDAIVAVHFFGHLPAAAANQATARAAAALAHGGRIYVIDHDWHARPALPAGVAALEERPLLGGMLRLTVLGEAAAGATARPGE